MWQCGGALLRRGILLLLLLIMAAALYSPASWADGTDPKPITQGCGGSNASCDATIIYNASQVYTITLVFRSASDPMNPFGTDAWVAEIVNGTGGTIDSYTEMFKQEKGLTYSSTCAGGFLTCVYDGGSTYTFTGSVLNSPTVNPRDPDCDGDDICYGVIIGLIPVEGDATPSYGSTLSSTIYDIQVPEPSSGLLLLSGLAVGLLGLRGLRNNLA